MNKREEMTSAISPTRAETLSQLFLKATHLHRQDDASSSQRINSDELSNETEI